MIDHAGRGQIPARRPRGTAAVHGASAGRGEVAGAADREAAPPAGRTPQPQVRRLIRDHRAASTGTGDERDRRRQDDREAAAPGRGAE